MGKKFWKLTNRKMYDQDTGNETVERTLTLNGTIAETSWFDDEISPQMFKDDLDSGTGDITVWINSPGGDCVAAAQIYNMLTAYDGKVTVKIDGIAASAASVIAMAGDEVLMSPVSMMMIHNPATIAMGDHSDMQKAMDMLNEVKESIINAYVVKTGQSRAKLSHLMDAETWMDANKAVELGFADGIIERVRGEDDYEPPTDILFSRKATDSILLNKVAAKCREEKKPIEEQAEIPASEQETGRSVAEVMGRLDVIKRLI